MGAVQGGDQNQHMDGLNWMVLVPNRWPWLAVLAAVVLALVVHGQAQSRVAYITLVLLKLRLLKS